MKIITQKITVSGKLLHKAENPLFDKRNYALHRFETVQFELALIWSFSPKKNVHKDCKRACLSYCLLRSRDFSLLVVRQGYRRFPLRS